MHYLDCNGYQCTIIELQNYYTFFCLQLCRVILFQPTLRSQESFAQDVVY